MGYHQLAAIKDIVADQSVEKGCYLLPKLWWLGLKLCQRFSQAVRDLHIAPAQLLDELDIMIAGDRQGTSGCDHLHCDTQYTRHIRPTIHQVAQEDGLATL